MGLVVKYILKRPTGKLTFRRIYPLDVQGVLGRELKTPIGHEADKSWMGRWEEAASLYDANVDRARRRLAGQYDRLDSAMVAYLAEVFRVELLEDDEAGRWSEEHREAYSAASEGLKALGVLGGAAWDGNEWLRWAEKARESINWTLPLYRELRANGDMRGIVAHWRSEAEELLEAKGLVIDPKADAPLAMLCRAMNDAAIAAAELRLKRLEGELVETPPIPQSPTAPSARQDVASRVPLLSTFDAYAKARHLTPGVRDEWRRYVQHFIKYLTHDDASRITADKVREWRDHLLDTPTRQGRLRDPVTVRDKYLMALGTTLGWAVDEGKLSENVVRQVKIKKPKKVRLRDPGFTDAEALSILKATLVPVVGKLAPYYVRARRWIPWLCAYTGARVNEFSQMRREDLQQIDGIWVVRITPEAGTVKTKEARLVPLHPHLIAQGFVEVIQAQKAGPLFYDPAQTRKDREGNRHFKKVGERLAKWVRDDVGIKDPALQPNHAWRHRFKSLTILHGIEERLADAIQGHAPSSTGRKYGTSPLAAMADAIAKLPPYEIAE
jgi:Site-specific recombinase XerD